MTDPIKKAAKELHIDILQYWGRRTHAQIQELIATTMRNEVDKAVQVKEDAIWAVANKRYGDIGMNAYTSEDAMRMVLDHAEEVKVQEKVAKAWKDAAKEIRQLQKDGYCDGSLDVAIARFKVQANRVRRGEA